MVSFTPPAAKTPTTQKYGRAPPRGPIRGFGNMLRIIATDFHYPRAILVNLGLLALFAVPLIQRETFYRRDSQRGSPWDRILADREKAEAAAAAKK